MRNLKKLLAVVLTVVMIASMMVPALAANTYEAEALKLQSIGMFAGEPADLKLEEGVTRIQGLAFAIRAAGVEADAFAMTDEEVATILDTYVDGADVPEWGRKYAAYAIKNGITVGVSATEKKFAALDPISGTSFLVFLMKAGMGYADVTTATVVEASVEAGILTAGQAAQFGAKAALIRDDAAAILYGAAMYGENADGQKFIDALIESGFVKEEDAIKAGFKEDPKAGELAVKDVEVLNLLQVKVTFNQNVKGNDEVEDADNYWFENDKGKDLKFDYGSGDGEDVDVITVRVEDNEAILTVGYEAGGNYYYFPLDNQTEAVLKISEDITGEELDFDIEFEDFDVPEILDAEVIGENDIKVTFSEPIWNGDRSNFKVESADGRTTYRVTRVTWAKAFTEAFIEVGKDFKDGDEIVLKVDGKLEDAADFNVKAQEFELVVEVDDRDIEVVDYRNATEEGVTLILNKDVELEDGSFYAYDASGLEDFYHTNSKNEAIEVIIDGNEIEINFDEDSELPEGTAYVYIRNEALVDLWGNENDTIRVKIQVDADTTAPEVEEIEIDAAGRTITIEFDQKLDEKSAEKKENYVILDSKKDEADAQVRSATLGGTGAKADRVVTLRLDGELSAGKYFIEIDGVKDTNNNATDALLEEFEVESGAIDLELDPTGDVELTVYVDNDDYNKYYGKVGGTEDDGEYTEYIIVVDYNRAMEVGDTRYSIENLDNYSVRFAGDSKLYTLTALDDESNYDVDISVDKGDAVVEIIIEIDNDEKHHELTELVISRVADSTGVLSVQPSKTYSPLTIVTEGARTGDLTVKNVKAIDTETVEIEFNKDIDDLEADDFTIRTKDTHVNLTGAIRLGSDDDKIIIKLDEELKDDATFGGKKLELVVRANSQTSTVYNEKLDAAGFKVDVKDGINPTFDEDKEDETEGIADGYKVVTTGSTIDITLYFTEDLDDTAVPAAVASTFVIKADDDTLKFVSDGNNLGSEGDHKYTLTVSGKTVTISVLADDAKEDVVITFTENNAFTDKAGNSVLDFDVIVFTD